MGGACDTACSGDYFDFGKIGLSKWISREHSPIRLMKEMIPIDRTYHCRAAGFGSDVGRCNSRARRFSVL